MFPSDIALLIGGPILAAILLFEANREHKIHVERRGLFRFPTALFFTIFACLGTAVLYAKVNPYVIYSYPNAVFFSIFSLGFVILYIILAGAARIRPTPHQTTAVYGELFLLWWIILAIDVKGLIVTRTFFYAPFLYMSALIGLSAMLLQAIRPQQLPGTIRLPENDENDTNGHTANGVSTRKKLLQWGKVVNSWDLNLRRVTIIGITLATQLGYFIVLMVMKNKWINYQQPRDVMIVDATAALFLVLPLATFMHKLHWTMPFTFTLVFISTFFFSLFVFPFTAKAPASLVFTQVLSLDNGTNIVQLTGPQGYTEYDVVPHLPSFKRSIDLHFCEEAPMGLAGQPESTTCYWHGLPPPDPPLDLLLTRQLRSLGSTKVWVTYAPNCTGYGLEFKGPYQPIWEGISRSEESSGRVIETFKVETPDDSPVYTARVSCVWNALKTSDIPAFTEADLFSPEWVRVKGDSEGLVTAERFIEV